MFTNLIRFFYKYSACLILFLFIQISVFALPPIRARNPEETRLLLLKEAANYIGTPYRYGGISSSGMDCSGFIYAAFQNALKVSIPRTVSSLYSWVETINTADLEPGDLVFFNTTGSVSHCGIYAGKERFIHSASDGPRTGVILSSLNESYWKRTYIGAGRAITKASSKRISELDPTSELVPDIQVTEWNVSISEQSSKDSAANFFLGGDISWNHSIHETRAIRGAGFHFGFDYDLPFGRQNLKIGLELRPEWDVQLNVFRLPLTLSFGNNLVKAFLGPVLSFGNPVLDVPEGERYFDGGSSWIGEAGITFTPFVFNVTSGQFAIHGEIAWQFYHPQTGQADNWIADLSAATRISTGIQYIFEI
jgi:probable lipoprotein NlpC